MIEELFNPKLYSLSEAIRIRNEMLSKGKIFILTNGCFDLLHPGHLSYLREAKEKGDVLWIALNGEKVLKNLKELRDLLCLIKKGLTC